MFPWTHLLLIDFMIRPYTMTHLLALKSPYLHRQLILVSLALNNLGSPVHGHELLSYKLSPYQRSAAKFSVSSN